MFQDFALFPHLSVAGNVAYGLKGTKAEKRARVEELLARVDLSQFIDGFPHQLSGGEQQRVAIASALLNTPEMILADEPTGNLDPKTSVEIMNVLEEINKAGITILMATHDYALILKFPHKTIKCEGGKIFEVV
jgi:cell division transport system ATP-binding protein